MSCSPKSQSSTVTCATEGSENGPRGAAGTVSHVIRKLAASITSLKKSFSGRQHGGSEDLIKWQDIELTTEIGRGALFTVYKGQWAGNKVAVKVLRPELCSSAQGMKLLKKEVKLQMARQHRRIARVYGLVSNGQQYHGVVQHLYEGGTLEQLINKQPVPGKPRLLYQDLNLVWRLRLAYQVARAMQHLASVSIVHGDLRTANLLLDSKCLNPQQIQVVVANLGTSRPLQQLHAHASTLCHQTSLAAHSDSQGQMLPVILSVPEGGPPGQASHSSRPSSSVTDPRVVPPELVADPTFPRSQATDVWAFGFVLYEIVTGLKAFKEMDRFPLVASKIATHVARGNRPAIPPDVPPMVSEVMQRCWEANPAARPPFDAIADQLEVAQEVLVRELVARADGTAAQYADTSFK